MDKTFGNLKSDVYSWLNVNTTRLPDAVLRDIVNSEIHRLAASYDVYFAEAEYELVTEASEDRYDFPDDYSRPIEIWYVDGNGDAKRVDYMDRERFYIRYTGADDGSPAVFTTFGEKIVLGPPPDAIYTMTLRYFAYPAELNSDGQTNSFITKAYNLVLHACLLRASEYLLEDERMPMFEKLYNRTKNQFLIEQSRAKHAAHRPQSREPGAE